MPLFADERVAWVEAVDLIAGGRIWLPFDAVEFNRTRIHPRYWQSSDGLASGNNATEAILHGLLERIERDALALWTVTSGRRRFARRIDTDHLKHAAPVEGAGGRPAALPL
jgi:ribosomal protein S12 methylthiotransferase accessory factor